MSDQASCGQVNACRPLGSEGGNRVIIYRNDDRPGDQSGPPGRDIQLP